MRRNDFDERAGLINEATQCGGRVVDGVIHFPNGETVPEPVWKPYVPPATHAPMPQPLPSDTPPAAAPPGTRLTKPAVPPWVTEPTTTPARPR